MAKAAPSRRCQPSSPNSSSAYALQAAVWEEQTGMDGTQDKVAMHRQTDLSLTAAAVTACGKKRGQCSRPPKVHTAGEEEMLSQCLEINQDFIP